MRQPWSMAMPMPTGLGRKEYSLSLLMWGKISVALMFLGTPVPNLLFGFLSAVFAGHLECPAHLNGSLSTATASRPGGHWPVGGGACILFYIILLLWEIAFN
jgi:hypothetical protein